MGVSYIERGAYEVIRAEDSQIIGPSELASMAQPGMKLEISIVMRQRVADQRKCPRCGYINLRAAVRGWIEWQVSSHITMHKDNYLTHGYISHQCSGQFRIAEADRSSHEQSDTRIDEDLSEKVDEENGGNTNTESGDEQIVSFASYVTSFPTTSHRLLIGVLVSREASEARSLHHKTGKKTTHLV
jgi:hypothetical protein